MFERLSRHMAPALFAAMAIATPTFAADPSPASIAKGQKLATKLCARCHNITPTGKSPHDKAPPFRTFAQKWPLENLEEALGEGIVVGHPDMPEFELTGPQITNLLDFMGDLAKKKK